jgi:hypothetical protein
VVKLGNERQGKFLANESRHTRKASFCPESRWLNSGKQVSVNLNVTCVIDTAMFVRVFSFSSSNIHAVRRSLASAAYIDPVQKGNPAITTTPHNITIQQREVLDNALRVDQAGEVAANWIYQGQLCILGRDPSSAPLIKASPETSSY